MAQRRIPEETGGSSGVIDKEGLFKNPAGGSGIYINLEPLGGTLKGTYTNLATTTQGGPYTLRTGGQSATPVTTSTVANWSPSNNEVLSINRVEGFIQHGAVTGSRVSVNIQVPSTTLRVSPIGSGGRPDGYAVTRGLTEIQVGTTLDQNADFTVRQELLPRMENRFAVGGNQVNLLPVSGGSQEFRVGGSVPGGALGTVKSFGFYIDASVVQFSVL